MSSESLSMCPHCGQVWLIRVLPLGKIPAHGKPACPGSGQNPRNPEADWRTLWKDAATTQ
jgi:hypothetical protein